MALAALERSKLGSVDGTLSALISVNGTTATLANFSALEEGYASISSYFRLYF